MNNPGECLYAFTEFRYVTYPGYINVSRRSDGLYVVTVRSREAQQASEIVLDPEQFLAFKASL